MTDQPEALLLADRLMHGSPTWTRRDAAAELRRLHAEVERLRAVAGQALEALETVQPQNMGRLIYPAKKALRAALAKEKAS